MAAPAATSDEWCSRTCSREHDTIPAARYQSFPNRDRRARTADAQNAAEA